MQRRIKAGVACVQLLSLSLPQTCRLTIWAASVCFWWTNNMSSILSIRLCHFPFTRGGGSTLICLPCFFLLPKPDSVIHSRMDHMHNFPFVCKRQHCCLYHFWRQLPAMSNNGGRKTATAAKKQLVKYFFCSNTYVPITSIVILMQTHTLILTLFPLTDTLICLANELWVILGPTKSLTLSFSNPGGCWDVCVTFVSIWVKRGTAA